MENGNREEIHGLSLHVTLKDGISKITYIKETRKNVDLKSRKEYLLLSYFLQIFRP